MSQWLCLLVAATSLLGCPSEEPAKTEQLPSSSDADKVPEGPAMISEPAADPIIEPTTEPEPPLTLSSTESYTGAMTCVACQAKQMSVTIRPDGVYQVLVRLLDEDRIVAQRFGRWQKVDESTGVAVKLLGTEYVLLAEPEQGGLIWFDPTSTEKLTLVSTEDHLYHHPMPITGVFRYMADAGNLIECHSQLKLPVLQRADSLALEKAYLDAIKEPAEPMVVGVEATIVTTPGEEGGDERWQIDGFIETSGVASCEEKFAEPTITGTYWKLLTIDGMEVTAGESKLEIHVVLGAEARAHGFAGCNRYFAQYEVDDSSIRLHSIGGTKRACPSGGMNAEKAFLDALGLVDSYKITGQSMTLFHSGQPLLKLEAVYLN
ncbi:META domain-containing protein [Corallincola platygyrae]